MGNKPKYNPQVHHRRSIRLKGYDYSQAGAYFITICCHDKVCKFGVIENEEMILNDTGIIAYNEWWQLAQRFPNIELDVFQIMPNHMHAIVFLKNTRDTEKPQRVAANNLDAGQPQGIAPTDKTTGDIVGAYKSLVAKRCLSAFKQKWINASDRPHMGKIWQRNYHEHIIRNEQSYHTIATYIINNPVNWTQDKFYQ